MNKSLIICLAVLTALTCSKFTNLRKEDSLTFFEDLYDQFNKRTIDFTLIREDFNVTIKVGESITLTGMFRQDENHIFIPFNLNKEVLAEIDDFDVIEELNEEIRDYIGKAPGKSDIIVKKINTDNFDEEEPIVAVVHVTVEEA